LVSWVEGLRDLGFWSKLKKSLRTERREAGALKEVMAAIKKEMRLGGEVLLIGRCHSQAHAETVRDRYRDAG
jgi:hypothetical protein